jgi:hypothetical protein
MAKPRISLATTPPRHLSSEFIARSLEWQNLATKLEQRADTWTAAVARWEHRRDPRTAIAGYRTHWAAEQARQFAAWLRLASDHLATLAADAP